MNENDGASLMLKATELHAGPLTISLDRDDVTTIQPSDAIFTVHGVNEEPLVTMYRDGRMEFGPTYAPNEAARIWWKAVQEMGVVLAELEAEGDLTEVPS